MPDRQYSKMNSSATSRMWVLGILVAMGVLTWGFLDDFSSPWTDKLDANGACWSQSAHNTLRAGLRATAGVPSAFYFGTLPIPSDGYYSHHPPLLSLTLAGMFAVLGEKEWVARLLPVSFSFISVVLLWMLMQRCVNARAATLCVVCFAAMPMELRYGRMVNFEPINLVWMLGGLLGLRLWEQTGRRAWRLLMLVCLALSLWTEWLGYLFVLLLIPRLSCSPNRRNAGVVFWLLGISVASLLLFLVQVRNVQPDAWHGMLAATARRMGQAGIQVTWGHWWTRMLDVLGSHIQPAAWLLALGGGLVVWRSKGSEALRWLGWAASCFVVMSVIYVTAFRNLSSIHDYVSFYFAVPVAMMAGVGLDSLVRWSKSRGRVLYTAACSATLLVVVLLVGTGERQASGLRRQFHILASDQPEPPSLIPQLGRMMREKFPEDTAVICNFLPDYGPQLHYYAQRELLQNASEPAHWKALIDDPQNAPLAGVVWLEAPGATDILSTLPRGTQETITIAGIPFCFWRPQ